MREVGAPCRGQCARGYERAQREVRTHQEAGQRKRSSSPAALRVCPTKTMCSGLTRGVTHPVVLLRFRRRSLYDARASAEEN